MSEKASTYDSAADTLRHIMRVRDLLGEFAAELIRRGARHDQSKLGPNEKPLFDEMTPLLESLTYGTEEYKASLAALSPALEHHYAENSHHPEHYANRINGMTLHDLVEMFCDWKASSERTANGSFLNSLPHNKKRFEMTDQLEDIFKNTAIHLGWRPAE